ncbi:hypothetical protein BY996DRAFT_6409996 [Phakopsora pachyrhizi]|nr:hypothetical protein BY996DRAFT_6409996 [Phakopsora pachyrhizi]
MTMKNLNEKPNEWENKYLPIAFSDEDNKARLIVATEIMKNIIVHDGNPEQQIPRLIELAKMLFEWAAPKGTSYSNKEIKEKFKDSKLCKRFYNIIFKLDNYISKKKVEEEIVGLENNSSSNFDDNSGVD